MTDRTTRKPMELHRGDTITRHPVDPDQPVMWTVVSRQLNDGRVDIWYAADGAEHVISVDPVAELTVRPEPRMAMVHGLRQAATFLETHPDVPVDKYDTAVLTHIFTYGDNAEQRAEIDRVARVIDGKTEQGRHYETSRWFGPVEYRAVSCDNPAPATAEGDAR